MNNWIEFTEWVRNNAKNGHDGGWHIESGNPNFVKCLTSKELVEEYLSTLPEPPQEKDDTLGNMLFRKPDFPAQQKDNDVAGDEKCKVCGNEIGNKVFTVCDNCWDENLVTGKKQDNE